MHDVDVDAYGLRFVLVFQPERHISVCPHDAVGVVGAPLYHALVDEFGERLVFNHQPEVEEELVPESAVNQVPCRVFASAEVQVHLLPVFVGFAAHKFAAVMRVHVAQIVRR